MIRVLVVDDDFMVAKVHAGYVERTEGFTVVGVAHGGAEALRLAREAVPDLVLLDVYLPDMDGIEVLRGLRGDPATADTDVLVITAASDADTVRAAMRGGAVHYLIKPFSQRALSDALGRVAALHERLRRLSRSDSADQSDVDAVFGAPPGRPAASSALPKGLSEQTAAMVSAALRERPAGISASECAGVTAISRPSARRYLEHFAATGAAEVSLRYGSTGRPERVYRPSAAT